MAAKKVGNGKAARRAKDCVILINNGQVERAFRLARKRNIEIMMASDKPNTSFGIVHGLDIETGKDLYARIAR